MKNLNNYTHQTLKDIVTTAKGYLIANDEPYTDIVLVNYQEQEDDEGIFYEIYESKIFIELETEYDEALDEQIRNEKLVKTYKTKRGLIQAMLNDKDEAGRRYRTHTIL